MIFFLDIKSGLSFYKKHIKTLQGKTFALHLAYSIIEGVLFGVLALNEFVLIKGLNGTDYQIGLLFQFMVLVLLFSVLFNEFFKRTIKRRKLIKFVGIITRLPLILLIFFPAHSIEEASQLTYQLIFLGVFLIYYLSGPLTLPAINLFLRKNYSDKNFSKFYGYATTANKIVVLFVTFGFGILLDYFPHSYIYVYPTLAIFGISSIIILTKIDYTPPKIELTKKKSFIESLKESSLNMFSIIKNNKPFRDFELGFMLYGFAWLVSMAVIAIYLSEELDLNYSSLAFYKNSYTTISIVVTPFFAKLIGNIDPRKFSIYTFFGLLVYLFFMGLTEYFPQKFIIWDITIYYSLILSFFAYGLFGAMMGLLWYIGSTYFCNADESADYQAIHLSLTGFRGAFAPLVGILFYKLIGFTGVFVLAIISVTLSILVNYWSLKKRKKIEH